VEGGAARQVTFASPVPAAGLVVRAGPTGTTVGVPTMVTAEAGEVSLDGRMQSYVVPPHWTFTGTLAGFGVFRNSRPSGWARLRSTGGGPASTGNTFDAGAPGQDGSQRITVHTTGPVVLQRSVAWTTGWQATVTPATSSGTTSTAPATTVPVVQDGVIQQVRLPAAGDFVVNFTYAPAAAIWGIVVSGATAAAVAIWVMAEGVAAYRRRGRTGSSRRSPPGVTPG
jgi:hypothetical protein